MAINHLAVLVAQRLQSARSTALATVNSPTATTRLTNASAPPLVGTAVLELAPSPLHQQIQQFAERALAQGYTQLQVVPLFLLPGVHVMEDIPTEVEQAQQALGSSIALEIRPHLGSHPPLPNLLERLDNSIATIPSPGKILLAHGSRRPGGNQPVEQIAARLNALPAYWSVPPDLETQLTALVKQGCQQIAILSYFLFAGGITDAIAQEVDRLAFQFSQVQIHLSPPIGATPALAEQILALLE